MADLIRDVISKYVKKNKGIQEFSAGDTVGVYVKVKEGDKERIQLYKGVVLKIQGTGSTRAFVVRKVSAGIGVERSFPFMSPMIDRVELIARGQVRRSRLYFLRGLKGRSARLTTTLVGLRDEKADKAAPVEATDEAAQ
ncbi:MAG: 50S ribosomal protein L19 [Bdellovibrionota bacterium]